MTKKQSEKRPAPPNCPKCGHDQTRYNGTNGSGTQRIYCKKCGKSSVTSGRKPGGQPGPTPPKTSSERYKAWYKKNRDEINQQRREQRKAARLAKQQEKADDLPIE